MAELDPEELTKERSLFEIFKKSSKLPSSNLNKITNFLVLTLLIVHVALTSENAHDMAERVRLIANLGLNFVVGMLGFLIAGFTIFATITDKKLFKEMAKVDAPFGKISYLKYIFFVFMQVFIYFVTFGIFCLLIILFASSKGFMTLLLDSIPYLKIYFAKAGFVIIGSSFFFLIMTLKSFIFNIYHTVMITIRWEFEKPGA